jgi:hypothetical protein
LTLANDGEVTFELFSAGGPADNIVLTQRVNGGPEQNVSYAQNGCITDEVFIDQPQGRPLLVHFKAVFGCRIRLDANPDVAGIQPFPAGTEIFFRSRVPAFPLPPMTVSPVPMPPDQHFDSRVRKLSWPGVNGGKPLVLVMRVGTDADGDGLWDDWETAGVDTDLDGVADFPPPPGANPFHKDLYLWIDWMDCQQGGCAAGDTHQHRPPQSAIDTLVALFRDAPIPNPLAPGETQPRPGITLHVEPFDGNAVPHQEFLNSPCSGQLASNSDFLAAKQRPGGFTATPFGRHFFYHYALFAHRQDPFDDGSSGCAELPGANLVVTLADWNRAGDANLDARALLHELGHNLGLTHGAQAPNYQSTMNYNYFFDVNFLDFSRETLPDLVEAIPVPGAPGQFSGGLNETVGLAGARRPVQYMCPDGSHGIAASAQGPIDWNCDGHTDDPAVESDINGDRVCIRPGRDHHRDTPPDQIGVVGLAGELWNDATRTCGNGHFDDSSGVPQALGDDAEVRNISMPQPGVVKGSNDWSHLALDLRFDLRSTLGNAGGGCGGLDQNDGPGPRQAAATPVRTLAAPNVPNTGTPCRGAGLIDGVFDVSRPNVVRLKVAELTTASTVFAGNQAMFATQVVRNPAAGLAALRIDHTVDGPASFVAGGCTTTPPGGQCLDSGAAQTVVVDSVPKDVVVPASVKLAVACSAPNGAAIVETAEALYADLSRSQDRRASVGIKVSNPPPVFTFVPPAVTISRCNASDIGRAQAQAGSPFCRTTPVTVTNDAPARFPLGKTIVTWTATDAAGQRTVAFQEVTAILGDDASCCPRGSNVIVGTPGSDVLIGTDGPDCILGLGGDDVLVGLGGNDVLSGGDGNDTLDGGDGDDILFGGRGLDILSGGPGGDQLWGGEGDDQLDGGDGNDALHGEAGSDQLNGGRGDDLLDGGPGVDSCTGGGGNDKFVSCAAATP